MAGVGNRCNREDLETRSTATSVVWRTLRDLGAPASATDVCQLVEFTREQVQSAMYSLAKVGWAIRVEYRGREAYYEALLERLMPDVISNESAAGKTRIKQILGRLVTKAYAARRTGLTQAMAQALFDLEKELRELRSALG